ncbi:pyridoxal phosphate-dependent aminotransferase [Myxococcota bacterium]|nr:pyridoxal phosphate-dependent aminotransferase [Myxococcota bacterium]
MPRPPVCVPNIAAMPGSVYAPVKSRTETVEGQVCPLNVGDTWRTPLEGARLEDIHQLDHPGIHRYSDPRGLPELIDALVEKVRTRNGFPAEREGVLVAAGATSGLACAVGMLAGPGEQVLILAPFWPLIRGAVQAFGAEPVEVPFFDRVDSVDAAVAAVREKLTARTVALYVCTPSNPTGRVIPAEWLEAFAELARSENLWLLSDEVYENFAYRMPHLSLGSLAPERTLTAYSFSKAYGLAGYRIGYVVGPPAAIAQAGKIASHTYYAAPTAAQFAALRLLRDGDAWLAEARAAYQRVGDDAADILGVARPEGSTFLFLDASPALDERGISGFLADCLAEGVALSPGISCGRDYENWARLCYTAAPPDDVLAAIPRVAQRLGRGSGR